MFQLSELFNSAFKDRRVLVTGHTGFKGAWLSQWLHMLGASVTGYALDPPTSPNLFDSLNLANRLTHIKGDVRDYDCLKRAIDESRPEIVFHMAAQSLVGCSYSKPGLTYDTNVMGTVNLLEAVRQSTDVSVIINVTSDKCYRNMERRYAYRESDPMGGADPYSSSKGCAELITGAYHRSFFNESSGKKMASVRSGNVIGGGDWAKDRLLPDCVKALHQNGLIRVRKPFAVRPWQYVLEPLSGYLWLACLMLSGSDRKFNGAYNFGPTGKKMIPVKQLVEQVVNSWGSGEWETFDDDSLPEAGLLMLNSAKARRRLGWHTIYDVYKTIEKTTTWYKDYYQKNVDIEKLTAQQIREYAEEAGSKKVKWAQVS